MSKTSNTQPVLFLAHGNPMNMLVENPYCQSWRELVPNHSKPEAILVISAHWQTLGSQLTAQEKPPTIHDFGGFPEALFQMQYPCPGAPALAQSLNRRFSLGLSEQWGLDHGSWTVLREIYPAADIPVLQLSLDTQLSPEQHYQLGRKLGALRDEGVMIIGSGNIVHNIQKWLRDPDGPFEWAERFDTAICEAIEQGEHQKAIDYHTLEGALDSVPTAEHFLPLLYVLGASRDSDRLSFKRFPASTLENCSMTSLAYL